ncbi:hypothetical protein AAW01_05260 [Aurantiacibacter gangjinensis]|uniref:Carbohydrate kinase PfkB domain-containing protein n=2 Tax=Aurantiacibacter gangjinensis TaxID=502682 RepID=A0A0G9MRJ0_9SPHN|nr:hypothetical protein AAW01_05260 [Aurantiacibacter gangjinensis]
MIELSRVPDQEMWSISFGGDCANVAIYCARLGLETHFMSATGQDPYSASMRAFLTAEGVCDDLLLVHHDRLPGLYAIQTDASGERTFTYWRDSSAARGFHEVEGSAQALQNASEADVFYLSGITLSLFDRNYRAQIAELARSVRARGGHVAFDGNYRARGWADPAAAREAVASMAGHCSIALPTFDDERALHGDTHEDQAIRRWHDAGVDLVVLKVGAEGAVVSSKDGTAERVPIAQPRDAYDTTGAGDSFNAGFLSAYLAGATALEAAAAGNRLAGEVVMHPGAIIPAEAMPV